MEQASGFSENETERPQPKSNRNPEINRDRRRNGIIFKDIAKDAPFLKSGVRSPKSEVRSSKFGVDSTSDFNFFTGPASVFLRDISAHSTGALLCAVRQVFLSTSASGKMFRVPPCARPAVEAHNC